MSEALLLAPDRPADVEQLTLGTDRALIGAFVVLAGLLFLLPGRYTVPLGGSLGLRPYEIVLLIVAALLARRFLRGARLSVGRPAWIAGLLVVTAVVSIVANQDLTNEAFQDSFRLVVTTMFHVTVALCVGLLAGTPRRRRIVVGTVVSMVAVASLFAIREAVTVEPIRLDPTPPALVEEKTEEDLDYDGASTIIRNGVPRPAGVSANPLELTAVMALTLPLAVYMFLSAAAWRSRLWFLACSVLVAVTVVLSISRTGLLAVAAILLVAAAAHLHRPRMILGGVALVVALSATVATLAPASVDALFRQFEKNADQDHSLATRLQDYEELDDLLGPSPWFGRGPNALGTYVARDGGTLILDNQYLLLIAETGVIGLAGLLVLLTSTGATALARMREPTTERGLWVAASAAVVAFAIMCATFDALRFAQAASLFMIVVGLVSASTLGSDAKAGQPSSAGLV